MRLAFVKMQGLGNDFVLIDTRTETFVPSEQAIRALADRRLGVGCDQVLLVAAPSVAGARVDYRIFNASGEEVEHCGNGVRCVARYLLARGELALGARATVNIGGRTVTVMPTSADAVQVDMGVPEFSPQAIPLARAQRANTYRFALPSGDAVVAGVVSMGNPHVVIAVADVATAPVATLGPAMESHVDFPKRVNVGFLQVMRPDFVRLRVYERGVGETPACGTGACGAVAVGRLWGQLAERVRVALPGGELEIAWPGEGAPLHMTGPAQWVFEGSLEQ